MLDVLRKYSGVLFFYLAIIGMILLANVRFSNLENTSSNNVVAISE